MDRRDVLRWGGTLVSLSACPWLAGCESEPRADSKELPRPPEPISPPRTSPPSEFEVDPALAVELDLQGTLWRARSLGKPALIFVSDRGMPRANPDRGTLFARLLWKTKGDFWADLGLCELACASMEEIRAALPDAAVEGNPYFVLVEPDPGPTRAAAIEVTAPGPFDPAWKSEFKQLAMDLDLEKWRSSLHGVIAGNLDGLNRRAEAARVALRTEAVARVEAVMQSKETPSDAMLASAAALFLLEAEKQPKAAMHYRVLLEHRTSVRVMEYGISGAGWARSVSCGAPAKRRYSERIPNSGNLGIACGMGNVSEFGNRFLWYYSDEKR